MSDGGAGRRRRRGVARATAGGRLGRRSVRPRRLLRALGALGTPRRVGALTGLLRASAARRGPPPPPAAVSPAGAVHRLHRPLPRQHGPERRGDVVGAVGLGELARQRGRRHAERDRRALDRRHRRVLQQRVGGLVALADLGHHLGPHPAQCRGVERTGGRRGALRAPASARARAPAECSGAAGRSWAARAFRALGRRLRALPGSVARRLVTGRDGGRRPVGGRDDGGVELAGARGRVLVGALRRPAEAGGRVVRTGRARPTARRRSTPSRRWIIAASADEAAGSSMRAQTSSSSSRARGRPAHLGERGVHELGVAGQRRRAEALRLVDHPLHLVGRDVDETALAGVGHGAGRG